MCHFYSHIKRQNKLYHLDGDLLLRLPQLYAIHLAGSNPWRCDCRLRGLVRKLIHNNNNNNNDNNIDNNNGAGGFHSNGNYKNSSSYSKNIMTSSAGAPVKQRIFLEDEPRCFIAAGGRPPSAARLTSSANLGASTESSHSTQTNNHPKKALSFSREPEQQQQQLGADAHQHQVEKRSTTSWPEREQRLESVEASSLGQWSKLWTNMSK